MDKVRRTSLSDVVTDSVVAQIREGRYRAGDRLPNERELAQQLGVGRTPVREVLRFLGKPSILEIRQGTVVCTLSLGEVFEHLVPIQTIIEFPDRDFRHIIHVGRVLEAESCPTRRSARHRKATDGMAASLENPRDYLEMDLEFPVVLAEAAANPVLAQLIGLIRDIYTRYFEIVLRDPDMNKTSLDFHRQLHAAVFTTHRAFVVPF